jgi:Flp pilus assembly protein TadB
MNGAYDMILSQTGLSGIAIIAVTLLTAVMVYQLLPTLVCQWDPRFKQAVRSNNRIDLKMEKKRKISVWIGRLIDKQKRQLILAGFDQTRFHTLYLVSLGLVAVIGLFVSLCVNIKAAPLLLAVFVISQSNLMIHRRAKVRMKHFARGSYKIYRFIHEQVSSGISLPDALKGLPSAIRDPVVQPVLVRFSALYALTLDFDRAFDIVRESFGEDETRMLGAQIRQSLQSGVAGSSMARMEELLFVRTYTLLQEETNRMRSTLVWIVAGALVPVLIIFLYPMLFEALAATRSVFS